MKKRASFCFVLVLLAIACAINPVTGQRELSLISEQEEIGLGQRTDAEIGQEYGYYSDPQLAQYVSSIGMALAPHTHRPNLPYHFAVLDSPVVNAFAAPGGYVYVTRGILALMNSESELAAVLGHELGHVNAKHSIRMLSTQILVQAGLAVGSMLSETFAKIAGVAGIGAQLLFLKFSRDDERQADSLGVQYARAGQYNTGEMVNFFTSLERYGDMQGGHSLLPGFLSTHPLTSERIQNVKALLAEADLALPKKREPYLDRINGLIYGDDPRQGFAEGNVFFHPQMRFVFNIPQGWQVKNAPAQVSLASEKEDAAINLQAEKTNEDLAAFAQKKAATIEGRQLINEQSGKTNGLASYHQIYDIVEQNKETLRSRLSFIRKNDTIYYFIQLSKAADFNRFNEIFMNVSASFKELSDPKYLNRQPQHLRILKADGQHSLQSYFVQNNVKKESWPSLAIMNGRSKAEEIPESGEFVKIIR